MKQLLQLGFLILFAAIVVGWFWGVPYLFHLIMPHISYTLFATVWLSIALVKNIYGRIKAQSQLKQIAEVQKIMEGQ
ncbi:hypothetical protein [Bacillus altitudinis]|uniref:hypothetical protein n=1 Tax=Bacillus altitudinis TaxID=293387 RepID=UPI0021018419|nr:hypothetical protein [Bacillus altitudinis]UTV34818.1 hypothetical protein NM966_19690 [Bacillus altitudinis]